MTKDTHPTIGDADPQVGSVARQRERRRPNRISAPRAASIDAPYRRRWSMRWRKISRRMIPSARAVPFSCAAARPSAGCPARNQVMRAGALSRPQAPAMAVRSPTLRGHDRARPRFMGSCRPIEPGGAGHAPVRRVPGLDGRLPRGGPGSCGPRLRDSIPAGAVRGSTASRPGPARAGASRRRRGAKSLRSVTEHSVCLSPCLSRNHILPEHPAHSGGGLIP